MPLSSHTRPTSRSLPCGLLRTDGGDHVDRHGTHWPFEFYGNIEGVNDHYALDATIGQIAPMDVLVMCDSESGTIFWYAADEASAGWVERAVEAISQRLTSYVPPRQPTQTEKLDGLTVA